MKFKINFDTKYIVWIIIILSIIYLFLKYYEEKFTIEKFFNNSSPTVNSSSTYYNNNVDSNTIQDISQFIYEQNNYLTDNNLKYLRDPLTGNYILNKNYKDDSWTGFYKTDNGTSDNNTDDQILVLRKIGDSIYFSLNSSSFQTHSPQTLNTDVGKKPDDYMYALTGIAKVDNTDINKLNIIQIIQDKYNSNPITDLSSLTNKQIIRIISGANSNLSFQLDPISLTNFIKSSNLTISNSYIKNPVLPVNYSINNVQLSDINCNPSQKKCTFTPNGSLTSYQACTNDNSNSSCNIISDNTNNVCYLQDPTDTSNTNDISYQLSGDDTVNISKCSPNFYVTQNNSDFMINNIYDNSNNLITCNYFQNLISNHIQNNYLILFMNDSHNIVDLSYQIWGVDKNESKLTTKKTSTINSFNNNFMITPSTTLLTSIQNDLGESSLNQTYTNDTKYNDISKVWEIIPAYNYNTCYFKIKSPRTNTSPEYYVNYTNNGNLYLSFLNGGFNQFFTLSDANTINTNIGGLTIWSGYIRAENGMYLVPGNNTEMTFDPTSSDLNKVINDCKLLSKMNVKGKWYICKYSKSNNINDLLK